MGIPHCSVCMKELKIGEQVIMEGIFNGILHADCNYLTEEYIEVRGRYEDVVIRNQKWFSGFISTLSRK
ncbi:hypothetical protein BCI9360_02400 [Bacillus sp. CECT 9360]|nr:hypothetical protein BCI9360_02400 [Bacillus sp. CECT 9360]